MTIAPRDFLAEYVEPAVALFGENMLVKHLAAHAISQMDNLAEVVALATRADADGTLKPGEGRRFREELRETEPVIGIIHDAHDCHKHGKLNRKSAANPIGIAHGGRPEKIEAEAFFVGVTECGGDLTAYDALAVTLNNGTEREVYHLLAAALEAWKRVFARLNI